MPSNSAEDGGISLRCRTVGNWLVLGTRISLYFHGTITTDPWLYEHLSEAQSDILHVYFINYSLLFPELWGTWPSLPFFWLERTWLVSSFKWYLFLMSFLFWFPILWCWTAVTGNKTKLLSKVQPQKKWL